MHVSQNVSHLWSILDSLQCTTSSLNGNLQKKQIFFIPCGRLMCDQYFGVIHLQQVLSQLPAILIIFHWIFEWLFPSHLHTFLVCFISVAILCFPKGLWPMRVALILTCVAFKTGFYILYLSQCPFAQNCSGWFRKHYPAKFRSKGFSKNTFWDIVDRAENSTF